MRRKQAEIYTFGAKQGAGSDGHCRGNEDPEEGLKIQFVEKLTDVFKRTTKRRSKSKSKKLR
jgi:hypothetical protein